MSSVNLTATVIRLEGEISAEAFRLVGDAIGRAFGRLADDAARLPIATGTPDGHVMPALARSNGRIAPARSNAQQPRKTRQKRQTRSPALAGRNTGGESPRESNGHHPAASGREAELAPAGKVKMADRIAEHIELRGPLSTSRLAQLLTTSEKSIALTMGHAKGRFLRNDNDDWTINESRR